MSGPASEKSPSEPIGGLGRGLARGALPSGPTNEHGRKQDSPCPVTIQSQLGRRPILAAGNTGGDLEMLEYATASDGPSLALLVDHDDE